MFRWPCKRNTGVTKADLLMLSYWSNVNLCKRCEEKRMSYKIESVRSTHWRGSRNWRCRKVKLDQEDRNGLGDSEGGCKIEFCHDCKSPVSQYEIDGRSCRAT